MGNYKYDDSIKQWYLKAIEEGSPKGTYKVNLVYIKVIAEWEEKFGRSIVDFTLNEITTLLRSLRFKSVSSFYTVTSVIKSYTEFAAAKLSKPMGQIQFVDMNKPEDFINSTAYNNRYTDRDNLIEKLETMPLGETKYYSNEEDGVLDRLLILLMYEGVRGKGYEEIIDLEKKDIDKEKKAIYIKSTKSYIRIKDNRVWGLIDIVLKRKNIMYTKDGENETESLRGDENEGYLFLRVVNKIGRPSSDSSIRNYTVEKFTAYYIKMQISKIMKAIDLPYITGVPLYISGLAERVHEWLEYNEIKFTRANVINYIELHGEKVGISGLLETIENLYYS